MGRPYALAGLSPLEQRIAAHMAQLGLLYTFKAVSRGQIEGPPAIKLLAGPQS